MKIMALMAALVLITFPPDGFRNKASAEAIRHFGQMVENSGGPYDCIVCHDGQSAKDAFYCKVECGFGNSHPVYKDYPPAAQESSYEPLETLAGKGIRLFNGKVSCVSCHDLGKSTRYLLINDNDRSSICFGCHRL